MLKTATKRYTLAGAAACLVALALYRIAAFVPQPLDSANTLRPVLNAAFVHYLNLFSTPQSAYGVWRAVGLVAMFTVAALGVARVRSQALFFTSVAFTLVWCRYPTLLTYQLNPDEGEFLSAAHKLFYNGNFFQAVDCGTSGPFNIYPLMLPAAVGISPDYASSRLLSVAIAFAIIWFLYSAFRTLTDAALARLATLPAVLVFATYEHPNLTHYSSEEVPMLLIAASLWLACRVLRSPKHYPFFLLGLLTGIGFLAKLQCVPILAAIAFLACLAVSLRAPRAAPGYAALYLLGTSVFPVANAALCWSSGVWKDFWMSYIVSSIGYVQAGEDSLAHIVQFAGFLVSTGETRFLLLTFAGISCFLLLSRFSQWLALGAALAIAAAGIFAKLDWPLGVLVAAMLIVCLVTRLTKPSAWPVALFAVASLVAIYCVYKPHRFFPHYVQLLIPPVCALCGMLLIHLRPTRSLACLFAVVCLTNQVYLWTRPFAHYQTANFGNVVPTIRHPDGPLIRALTRPDERIFMWGWTADPYLGSGRISATRDLNLFYQVGATPDTRTYYRDKFAYDLRRNPPALFIDAVTRESWIAQNPNEFGFDHSPEVDWFVKTNYIALPPTAAYRYFLRRDLAARAAGFAPKHCGEKALRCLEEPDRYYSFEAALLDGVATLPPLALTQPLRFRLDFTPMPVQSPNSTVFASSTSFRGIRFTRFDKHRYKLYLGLGKTWASSNPIFLKDSEPASLEIEIAHGNVTVRNQGKECDRFVLPSAIADSNLPITVGSGSRPDSRFTGVVSFFEVSKM